MKDVFFAQILIVILLLIAELRPFISRNKFNSSEMDIFAALPIISVIISIFALWVFGFQVSLLIAFSISLFVYIINIPSIVNLISGLSKNYFTGILKFFSIFALIATTSFIIISIIFMPQISTKKIINPEKIILTGDSIHGYEKTHNRLKKKLIQVNIFSKEGTLENKPAVIFIPDVFTSTKDNIFTLSALANKGYKVISFDIAYEGTPFKTNLYNKVFMRSFAFRTRKSILKDFSSDDLAKYNNLKKRQAQTAISVIKELKLADNFFILCENTTYDCWTDIIQHQGHKISGIYTINNKAEPVFNYTDGLGNLNLTCPLDYAILNNGKAKTDKLIPEIIASRADKAFKALSEQVSTEETFVEKLSTEEIPMNEASVETLSILEETQSE